jgi:hypothetical protein
MTMPRNGSTLAMRAGAGAFAQPSVASIAAAYERCVAFVACMRNGAARRRR